MNSGQFAKISPNPDSQPDLLKQSVYDASSACAYLDVIFSACADFLTGVSCFKRS